MEKTLSFIRNNNWIAMTIAVVAGVLLVVGGVQAATTISTNIETDGTLEVTGASTLTGLTTMIQASSTRFSVHGTAYFGGTATTTIDSTGIITLRNDETISNATDGTITLTADNVVLVGTASTSAIKVGDEVSVSTINGLIFGYCTAPSLNVAATSSATLLCADATGVASTDRVFVQATSSLPENFVIQAASSSATDTIQTRVFNMATSTPSYAADTGINSFNFWAVR